MSLGWQDVVALGFVLAAAVYFLRPRRKRKGPGRCAECALCPASNRRPKVVYVDSSDSKSSSS